MFRAWLVRICLFVCLVHAFAPNAWAFKREARIPLVGCRGYYAAQGSARYFAIRNVPKERDREDLVVEIDNVPMVPGTVLVVYIEDERIGTIKLNSKRAGSLTLTSEFRKFVPPVDAGTTVTIKTIDGKLVMW